MEPLKIKPDRSKIGKSSVRKGKTWELYFCHELEKLLKHPFIRTRAAEKWLRVFSGDIACTDQDTIYSQDISWQIKARESMDLFGAWEKARDDARGKLPIVIWKKVNRPALAVVSVEHMCRLLYELEGYRKEGRNK